MKIRYGFTLIDLLIAISILAILSSVTYPSFRHYLYISHRSDAHIGLLKLANLQEQFFLHAEKYASLDELMPISSKEGLLTEHGYYRITANITPSSYLLTATAIGTQANDVDCLILTLAQDGFRDSTSHEHCW